MERIKLSEHFNYGRLLRFVLPSVLMMLFVSLYGIVDGFFVAKFVGELEFAALNLIFPLIMIFGSVGFMLGTGGNAAVSKILGEGNRERANRVFSMLVYATVVIGVALSIIGIAIARPMAELFASKEEKLSAEDKALLIEYCVLYARTILMVLPAFMLQNAFQGFFITAEKPRLGLYVTLVAGVGNMIFDALFILVFDWGLFGAAMATALNQFIGGVLPLFYFARKNDSLLKLGKTSFDGRVFGKVCLNGISELMTNISLSIVGIVYNGQLIGLVGINGASAYGVLQYIGFIFVAIYLGYAVGCAPIIGYHYGAQNHNELKNVFRKSVVLTAIGGVVMTLVGYFFARPLSAIFVGSNQELWDMASGAMKINAFAFLVCGFNIFGSAFFTALSNGGLSLLISFARTFFFQVVAVLVLPIFLGLNGVWASLVVAEAVSLILTVILIFSQKKRYGYM